MHKTKFSVFCSFSSRFSGRYGMLGLGDIVLPGMLISFLLRYESSAKTSTNAPSAGAVKGGLQPKWTGYYFLSIVCFFVGEFSLLFYLLLYWLLALLLKMKSCENLFSASKSYKVFPYTKISSILNQKPRTQYSWCAFHPYFRTLRCEYWLSPN